MRFDRSHVVTGLLGLAAVTLLPAQVGAQQVYRIVGPDGRVTFSDKPPRDATAKLAPTVSLPAGGGASTAALPFELQQVASKYPVTLYTSSNCNACGSGRAYLTSRGIPFAEKTIGSPEDAEALQRMAGESVVPLLTVGGQQIRGYSDSEWSQFLDAAGYPKRSALPSSWRNPAPTPLVAVQRALSPAQAAEAARRNNPPPAAVPAPSAPLPEAPADNPAGIKF